MSQEDNAVASGAIARDSEEQQEASSCDLRSFPDRVHNANAVWITTADVQTQGMVEVQFALQSAHSANASAAIHCWTTISQSSVKAPCSLVVPHDLSILKID